MRPSSRPTRRRRGAYWWPTWARPRAGCWCAGWRSRRWRSAPSSASCDSDWAPLGSRRGSGWSTFSCSDAGAPLGGCSRSAWGSPLCSPASPRSLICRAAAAALWVDSRDLWSGPRTPPPSEVGEARPGESGPAQDAEPGPSTVATPAPPILLNAPSDKLTHFLGFAILAAVALLGFGSRGVVPVLGALVLLAVVTEVLQSFPITREAQWTDLASDGVGILTGAATYLGVRWSLARLRGRRRGVMNVPRPGSP